MNRVDEQQGPRPIRGFCLSATPRMAAVNPTMLRHLLHRPADDKASLPITPDHVNPKPNPSSLKGVGGGEQLGHDTQAQLAC